MDTWLGDLKVKETNSMAALPIDGNYQGIASKYHMLCLCRGVNNFNLTYIQFTGLSSTFI